MRLRPFTPLDDATLVGWVRTAEELFLFTGPMLTFPLDVAQLDGLRANPDLTQFAAVVDEVVVGHIELVSTGAESARVARVLIDPAHQGEGLGERLMRAVITEARERGIRTLALRVIPSNTRAIALYEKLGFEFTGVDDGANTMSLSMAGAG